MNKLMNINEIQFNKSLKKYFLGFNDLNLEKEFQDLRKEIFFRYTRYTCICFLSIFLLIYPFTLYKYLNEKDDDDISNERKVSYKIDIIIMPLFNVILFIELLLSKYVPVLKYCRLFLLTLVWYGYFLAYMYLYDEYLINTLILGLQSVLLLVMGHYGYYNFISGFIYNLIISILQLILIFALKIDCGSIFDLLFSFAVFIFLLGIILFHTEKIKKREYFMNKLLLKREEDLECLLNELPVGVLIQKEKEIKYANKSIGELFPSEENNIEAHIAEKDQEVLCKFLKEIEGRTESLSYINFKGGLKKEQRFELRRIEKIQFEGEETSVIVVKDISEFEELQIEKIKQKYKDMFVLSLSHELRTPLNGIIGVSESLEKELPEEEWKACARQITNSGYLLSHLIESVQDLSKIESDTFILHNSSISPRALVGRCLNCIGSEILSKNLNIETNMENNKELPEEILIDEKRYSQVLLSLLINASKYTYEGKVKVHLEYEYEKGVLWTTIEDTGIGIHEDFLPYIFSLYGKLKSAIHEDNPSTSPIEGIGLGLTISKQIINKMDGNITVESTQGIGTKITFSVKDKASQGSWGNMEMEIESSEGAEELKESLEDLDIHLEINNTNLERGSMWPSTVHSTELLNKNTPSRNVENSNLPIVHPVRNILDRKPHILMVDDNGFNLFSLKLLLKQFHALTQEARNGVEAIERVEENQKSVEKDELNITPFDMIFMDCNMPVMNGYQATEELRKRMEEGEIRDIPIVALTAYDDETNRELCIKAGMDDVLFKPLNLEKLKYTLLQFHII